MYFKTLVFGAAALLLASCGNPASEKGNTEATEKDTLAAIETTNDYREINIFEVEAGKLDIFFKTLQNNIANTRKERGNTAFAAFQPEDGTNKILLFEWFKSKADYDEHQNFDYLKAVRDFVEASAQTSIKNTPLKEVGEVPPVPVSGDALKNSTRNVIVFFDVKPDQRRTFVDAIKEMTPHSRQAPGNLGFNVFQYADDPNKFLLLEGWESVSDHEAHLAREYSQKFDAAIDGIFVSNPRDARWLAKNVSE